MTTKFTCKKTRKKPMVQSDEVFKASRFSGLELLQKTGRGRRKGKGTFAITFNSTIKRYYALIIQTFLDPLRPMILVKTVVHRGKNIFSGGGTQWHLFISKSSFCILDLTVRKVCHVP